VVSFLGVLRNISYLTFIKSTSGPLLYWVKNENVVRKRDFFGSLSSGCLPLCYMRINWVSI